MRIRARRHPKRAYPPIGRYARPHMFQGRFEDLEIKDPANFVLPIQLRPDGARQPTAEASILGNMRAKLQGRAGFPDGDIMNGAYK